MKTKDLHDRGQLFIYIIKWDSQMCVCAHEGSVIVVDVCSFAFCFWKNEGRNCTDWQNSCFISIVFLFTFIQRKLERALSLFNVTSKTAEYTHTPHKHKYLQVNVGNLWSSNLSPLEVSTSNRASVYTVP